MSIVSTDLSATDSMPEFPIPVGNRIEEIDAKHRLVSELLSQTQCDALLLLKPENISWFTSGADFRRSSNGQVRGAVFVTPDARVIMTSNVDSVELFDEDVPQLGFQLKERPWQQDRMALVDDICRGRRIASDSILPRLEYVGDSVQSLRLCLTPLERDRLRALSRVVVHAVEATARAAHPGMTEAEVSGELAHRLIKRCVAPVDLRVCSDGITERYRHWSGRNRGLEQFVSCSATGRRWGLHVTVTRTVCFHGIPKKLADAYDDALLVLATAMNFSRSDWPVTETWQRVERIYEKFGNAHEWLLAEQGAIMGHAAREKQMSPQTDTVLRDGMVVSWTPSIGAALLGETMLIGERNTEWLTRVESWPLRQIEVKGRVLSCPGLLDQSMNSSS